jgi:lipooligosaccharide transport system permease protein
MDAIGMFFTGITPSIGMSNLPIFLFITPMFIFSGTFFRCRTYRPGPSPWRWLFGATIMVELVRRFSLGGSQTHPAICIAYPLLFAVMFLLLAMRTMRKRLIS